MGNDSDKRKRFEEAFQRGQEGQVSNYEAWLKDKEIDPEKTSYEYLTQYFTQNPGQAVNHDKQIETIAEHLGFFSRRSDVYHLPIIGVSGIGKTQFLHTVSNLLGEIPVQFEQQFYDAEDFAKRSEDEELIFEIRDELQDLEKVVIYIDNCNWERGDSLIESFQIIESVVEDALIITSWTPEYWKHYREEVEEVLPTSKEIHLTSFSKAQTVEELFQILKVISDDGLELPEEYLNKIHDYSTGNPQVTTMLLLEALKETFLKELDLGDVKAVESAAEKLNLVDLEERVYNLSETQSTILTHILLSTDQDGIRPSQLVDLLDRDKSTVSYHLKNLTEEGLVASEKRGRSAYYRIKKSVKPMIQNKVNHDGEFNGKL